MLSLRAKGLLYEDEISLRMSLHSLRQSWGRSVYKYKYERYSAAERLFDECSIAFSKYGIAWLPGSFNDFSNKANDICSLSFISTESSYFCLTFSFGDCDSYFYTFTANGYLGSTFWFTFYGFRSESSKTLFSLTKDFSSYSLATPAGLGIDSFSYFYSNIFDSANFIKAEKFSISFFFINNGDWHSLTMSRTSLAIVSISGATGTTIHFWTLSSLISKSS